MMSCWLSLATKNRGPRENEGGAARKTLPRPPGAVAVARAARTRPAAAAFSLLFSLACSDDPRPGTDEPGPGQECSTEERKGVVFDLMTDLYYWYDRVPEVSLEDYESPQELLEAMRYAELDRWSGMQELEERQAFYEQGRFAGFGYSLDVDAQGQLRVAWVHEGSAASREGLGRGAVLLTINGLAVAESSPFDLGLELRKDEVTHDVLELDGTRREVTLTVGDVTLTSVKAARTVDTLTGRVGYFMFSAFIEPAEEELRDVFRLFREEEVDQLVVDLRYNGGGLLRVAATLASLIRQRDAGRPLIVETYNDRNSRFNRRRSLVEVEEGMNFEKVVFLTSGATASASEQVINGLRPFTEVRVVGAPTLGKPMGADSFSHCGWAITPITFASLNADGEGDYFDGIAPDCAALDDLTHALGDPEEAQFAAALGLLSGAPCPGRTAALRIQGARQLPLASPSRVPAFPSFY